MGWMPSKNYMDLITWRKAMSLAEVVYAVTQTLPREERFGLSAQMRRAAVSIPANIAEGQGRTTRGEFLKSPVLSARFSARIGDTRYAW